jgi:antitoxin component of MazEF toxin-antitoxin module
MKIAIRRVGNSLGVILPKSVLDAWGLGAGSQLELTERGLHPIARSTSHEILDQHKRRLAIAVTSRCTINLIRAHSLANLQRWKESGAWVSAYDEWQQLLERGTDGELFAVMLGHDARAERMRQSAPYVGLLPREEVRKLNEEATG